MAARQNIQLGIALALVIIAIGIPVLYVAEKGVTSDDELIKTIVVGSWTLAIAGAGAAFSLFGLGRKVSEK